jgi:hypothetical protein
MGKTGDDGINLTATVPRTDFYFSLPEKNKDSSLQSHP